MESRFAVLASAALLVGCLEREGVSVRAYGGHPPDPPSVSPDASIPVGRDGGIPPLGLDAGIITCSSCHGDETSAAPPTDTSGRSDPTLPSVGAHRIHLGSSDRHRAGRCDDCHVVPATVDAPLHISGTAELTFAPIAAAQGISPRYENGACTAYCHGASMSGGLDPVPSWTRGATGRFSCDSCHALPPYPPHPQLIGTSTCGPCHDWKGYRPLDPETHINGRVDVKTGCSGCHGSEASPAPAPDLQGRSDTSLRSVGAHASHLRGSDWHAAVACNDCHVVPERVDSPGHIDVTDGVAEVTFSERAKTVLGAPAFDGIKCSGVSCHGAALSGGTLTQPQWTRVDGSQVACGTCHGLPPGGTHPRSEACYLCHGEVVDRDRRFVRPELHINGVVDFSSRPSSDPCLGCHGSDGNPAPPRDTTGGTDRSLRTVGAHRAHLGPSPWHRAGQCADCHVVPTRIDSPGHIDDPPAELTFGPLARSGGVEPAYSADAKCSVYCHGASLSGGEIAAPEWTGAPGTQAYCGSCHGAPPPPPHPSIDPTKPSCGPCHPFNGWRPKDPARHIDGILDLDLSGPGTCGACHGFPPATGSHLAHAGLATGGYGALGTAADLDAPNGYAFGCGHCHPIDPSHHRNGGTAEVELYNPAAPSGSLKALHPATAKYTPGTSTLTDERGFRYTLGTCSDVYCHSAASISTSEVPYGAPNPDGGVYPLVYEPPFTVTRSRAYQAVTWGDAPAADTRCERCHGMPPRTYSDVPDGGVHRCAGDSHSCVDPYGYDNLHAWNHGSDPLQCRTCHADTVMGAAAATRVLDIAHYGPAALYAVDADGGARSGYALHVNGRPDVAFDRGATIDYFGTSVGLTSAQYDASSRSCSAISCHQQQTSVTWGSPYAWWDDPGSMECNSCHRF